MKTLNEQRKKWWEVATTRDEVNLFTSIARNPKYDWRTLNSLLNELGWDKERMDSVMKPFLHNKMILTKQTKKGMSIAYWERVKDEIELQEQNVELSDENKFNNLNKQLEILKKKMTMKQNSQKP